MDIQLDEEQLKAIEKLRRGKVLVGGVGSGKSRAALAYYFLKVCEGELKINGVGQSKAPVKPRDLYIITTAKKRDSLEWMDEAASFSLTGDPDISLSGITVTVDSWNNISNYEDVEDAYFLFDEQRLVGAGAWTKSFLQIAKRNGWILLTATPGDVWTDYCPVFVANGFYKNRTEFLRRHAVFNRFSKYPKIDRWVDECILESLRRRLLVTMDVKRHTRRHEIKVDVAYPQEELSKLFETRWNPFTNEPVVDAAELFAVSRRMVNSDLSRYGEVMALLERHPRLIIFYNFNYELEILRTLKVLDIPMAEWNGQKHEAIPDTDRWVYLVQYTAGAEGWNCTSTDATVFFSLNYSYKVNEQAKGRIDRRNTPYTHLYYYILVSDSVVDRAVMKSLDKKEDFNERAFVKRVIGGTGDTGDTSF